MRVHEHIRPTPEAVLPVYVLVDESASMQAGVDVLNAQIAFMLERLRMQPMAAAGIRLSVIGFSDVATCYLTLADVRDITEIPPFLSRGSTSYRAAFSELAERLTVDVDDLKLAGHSVRRPVVFFISDGHPNHDGWQESLRTVVETCNPLICAFGVGDVDRSALAEIAGDPVRAFTASPNLGLADALRQFVDGLTASIVHSSATSAEFIGHVVIEMPEGFDPLEPGQAHEPERADD